MGTLNKKGNVKGVKVFYDQEDRETTETKATGWFLSDRAYVLQFNVNDAIVEVELSRGSISRIAEGLNSILD